MEVKKSCLRERHSIINWIEPLHPVLPCILVMMLFLSTITMAASVSFEDQLQHLRMPHEKRNYLDLRCRGRYDRRILTQLDRVCEDCYNLYKDVEVHQFCRRDCFSTETFQQCLQSLLLDEDSPTYDTMVQIVGKKKRRKKRKK